MDVFALTDVKSLELVASVHNGVNASARDSYAPSDGELAEVEQVKSNAT